MLFLEPKPKTSTMIKSILLIPLLLLSVMVLSQNISGSVYDKSDRQPIVGAIVLVENTNIGGSTDFDGNFNFNYSGDLPVNIKVSFLGYQDKIVKVSNTTSRLKIYMEVDNEMLAEIDVVEQRLSDKQKESALTVEAMDALAIKETPSVSFYEGLGNLKGVDLTSASIGFKIINTRGFNSTSPVRSLQIIDGVDNQSPGLNFSLGNFLGASELDVLNVDVIAGASTAFYGPNAFNGVISMNTRNPFEFKGLTASVKVGERNMTEVAVRWADAIKNKDGVEKFAYKINLYHLRADDWVADNLEAVDESNFTDDPTPAGNFGGYDAVNRYGDEQPFDDGGDPKSYPGIGNYHRRGIEEVYLVNYDTRNTKIGTSLNYRFKPDLELIYAFNYGTGTTVYQGDNRFSLKDIRFMQNRLELVKHNKFFIRAYATNEDAGNSYDAYYTALRMQDQYVSTNAWAVQYQSFWNALQKPKIRQLPGYPTPQEEAAMGTNEFRSVMDTLVMDNPDFFRGLHENNKEILNAYYGLDALTPGTRAYDSLFNHITSKYVNEGGTRLYDKSALYHIHGEYKFDPIGAGNFTVGGNGRLYAPQTNGTIFSDSTESITNSEYGVYAGWDKTFNEKIKVSASARVDKNQNFDFLFSPAASVVFNLDDLNSLRISASSAIRNPTLSDQYLYYNTGPALLLGNLNGYDSLVTLDNIQEYLASVDRLGHEFDYYSVAPIRPEQVQTIEAGYRTTIFNRLFLDVNYYYSWYQHFIGYQVAAFIEEGTTAIDRLKDVQVVRVSSNATQQVTTQGFSMGFNYYFWKNYMLSGNYTWNVLNTGDDDPIVPAFNTPENKFNLSLGGRDLTIRGMKNSLIGFNVTYKWIEGFRFEGSPQFTGNIDTYDLLDAQLSWRQKNWNTTFKLGASNILNNKVFQVYGGPRVGRLAYFSITYDFVKKK